MKMDWCRRGLVVLSVLLLVGIVGCDDSSSDVDGVIAIIYAVGDLVIGILNAVL